MDKLKAIKVKQASGQYGEAIPIGVDATNVDLINGKDLETSVTFLDEESQETDVDFTAVELQRSDIVDNLSSTNGTTKVLSANQGRVLNNRVNNLDAQFQTAISAVTVDSEVQNIRVGADGHIYGSAGDAVREQVGELKSDLTDYSKALTIVESFNKYNMNTIIEDTTFSASTGKQMASSGFYTTDYIPCDGKEKVYLTFVSMNGTVNFNTTIPRIVFYTAKNEDSILSFNQTQYVKDVDVPENAKYCRLALDNNFKQVVVCISFNSYPTSINEIDTYYDSYYKKCLIDTDKEEIFNSIVSNNNNLEYGFLTKGNYDDADYCYIPVYGQSFTLANDGEYKITNTFDENCYMIGDSPAGYDSIITNPVINPLSTPDNYEYIQADMLDLLSKLSKKYAHINQNFIVSGVGKGGMPILKLSKNNGINDYYDRYFLTAVTNTKTAMNNAGKTFSCPFILYMQGESDYQTSDSTSCANTSNPKATYKERFLKLKNDMQADVISATGQNYKPVIITYCNGGNAFNNKYEDISTAQLELAEENDDVICVGPYYYAPDYKYHLTPDGRRWFAEHLAKVLYESFIKGIDNTLKIGKITATKNKIYIPIHNAVLPLKIDTYTIGAEKNNGFMVYDSIGNEIIVSDIGIHDNVIVITTANNISGSIKVTYGNSVCHGNGNVRDSDKWISYYSYESNAQGTSSNPITYIPKDENGNELIGKKYPIWKWLPNFGTEVIVD